MKIITLLSFLLVSVLTNALAQPVPRPVPCPESSYFCLDPQGREFGPVGPVTMWHRNPQTGCVPSSYTRQDACEQVAILCNSKHPDICNGDCLPGRAVSALEGSCVGTIPAAPSTTEYRYNMEVYP